MEKGWGQDEEATKGRVLGSTSNGFGARNMWVNQHNCRFREDPESGPVNQTRRRNP